MRNADKEDNKHKSNLKASYASHSGASNLNHKVLSIGTKMRQLLLNTAVGLGSMSQALSEV